jgi:hypothetical protein
MNSDNLKYVLREFAERPLPKCLPRDLSLPTESGKVIGLTGVRRSGKTFLFFDTIRRLVAQGVDRRQIAYLNFEDDRLYPLRAEELDLVLRTLRELFPETIGSRMYLFLDEVQNVPGWERWVRRLHDIENIALFVTGSSSRVLTRDLASAMRGRSVTYEVFPLSFREFLAFRGIAATEYDARQESRVRGALEEYLRWGGFPEVVTADPAMRPLILGEYASVMLCRDLVERHKIRNEPLIRALMRHCFRNTATLLNTSRLHRDFKSLGFSVSKNTLFGYMDILADAHLVFFLTKQEESLRKQAHNPRKLHVIDTGLIAAFKAGAERDVGHKLETAVFLECRRRSRDWHYYADGSEIDLCDAEGRNFFNVCWNMDEPATRQREMAAMALGAARWSGAKGMLLYHEYTPESAAAIPGAMPAWRWLLGAERPPSRRCFGAARVPLRGQRRATSKRGSLRRI